MYLLRHSINIYISWKQPFCNFVIILINNWTLQLFYLLWALPHPLQNFLKFLCGACIYHIFLQFFNKSYLHDKLFYLFIWINFHFFISGNWNLVESTIFVKKNLHFSIIFIFILLKFKIFFNNFIEMIQII